MDLLICSMCGSQHDTRFAKSCKICDDPRQYIPQEGQSWTTLRQLQQSKKYHNEFRMDKNHSGLISILTVPQVGIGQRAFLCCTPAGNVLWDCITYIDDDTIRQIKELGGIKAIVISHPHYYSTSVHWAEEFHCPVYISADDEEFLMRHAPTTRLITAAQSAKGHDSFPGHLLWEGKELNLLDGAFTAIKVGGHFPGSSVLLWKEAKKLLIADSIMVVPSGVYHVDRLPGTTSFSFMWSYPNFIPLPPNDVYAIWKSLAHLDFEDTHSAFWGRDTIGQSKKRLLESAQIYIKAAGYVDHAIHQENFKE
ncbi:metallo-beta-lactamase family protein [Paracoccidioides lutzii Pb01]|uniref:Metallo-beta-lactamase family protein n=1 Tax=Paracoccidioides lutzii (strain ATCC MYA-826 / Pb01) TaxID=502779 RepID=C1GXX8_PARBA|nr:metallo-beta-lactamase family protein [Paracoccidioides lutzii Pb01]EEH41698.1 metallo-beta-lactamase family protein [Paracoccidioides lutzii Pb01]